MVYEGSFDGPKKPCAIRTILKEMVLEKGVKLQEDFLKLCQRLLLGCIKQYVISAHREGNPPVALPSSSHTYCAGVRLWMGREA